MPLRLALFILSITAWAQNPSPCLNIVNTAGAGQVLSAVNGGTSTPPCRWITGGGGGGSGTVTSVGASNGLTASPNPITGAGTISGVNAAANGTTKGVSTFTASDFDATAGLISIDYVNGQKATAAQPGFLTAADWSTFNAKQAAGSYVLTTRSIATTAPLAGGGDLSADRTLTCNVASGSQPGCLSAADWTTFNNKGSGNGTVTSVGFTGGLISVANPTTTPAFTVAGTSGGIPYFSSTSTWASSGLQTANALILGGGAGAAPTPMGSLGTTTTILHGNAAGAPSFGAIVNADITNATIDLTTKVTGVLPTANIAVALANQTSLRGNAMAAAAGDATIGQVIAHGAKALDFASTATGACATVITDTATGAASTDVIIFNANASIKAVTGYVPAATGGFSIAAYPTANTVNFEACNWTAGTVDPGSITVNWMVIR